jgi:ribosomal-protein-alanine N-acetyltransferase
MAVLDWISPDAGPALDAGPVRLRAPRMSDHPEWADLRAVSRDFLQPWEPVWPEDDLSRAAFRRRLSLYARDRDLGQGHAFFIVRKSDEALVGGINLRNIMRGVAQSGAIGYWAGAPFARRGYTLAALNALSRFAFGSLKLHRLEAACCTDNEPSSRLLLKAGFHYEGLARSYLKINGIWRDHLLFGLLAEDVGAQDL